MVGEALINSHFVDAGVLHGVYRSAESPLNATEAPLVALITPTFSTF